MTANDITLYSFAISPYTLKVRCCLLYKDLPFRTVYVHPMRMKQELPVGDTVPVLTHGVESINESTDIALWLDDLYPDPPLVVEDKRSAIREADLWVTSRLIPAVFRVIVGTGESWRIAARRRWAASDLLRLTIPGGLSFPERILHLFLLGRLPFIRRAIISTDLSMNNRQLREQLAVEFVDLMGKGPFLCESAVPTLADLSAYPQVTFPYFQSDSEYFLPGKRIEEWALRVQSAIPRHKELLPAKLR